jgi:hypothetical protein
MTRGSLRILLNILLLVLLLVLKVVLELMIAQANPLLLVGADR